MKSHIITKGVILARTDYQEADRILTVLTSDHGKLRLIAKGVRRPKSKLAGGIELFSVNDLTVLPSVRDLKTLVSSRLDRHFGEITKDIHRTMLGYELLKQINRTTEDEPGAEYYDLAVGMLAGRDNALIDIELVELWFVMRLLVANGHGPNLAEDSSGQVLIEGGQYVFDFESMSFSAQSPGVYNASHIKLLRLAARADSPTVFTKVQNVQSHQKAALVLVKNIIRQNA